MILLAIDPGPEQSAWVTYDTECKLLLDFDLWPNDRVNGVCIYKAPEITHLVIEMIACYGMPVGKTVFDTCVWVGRFIEAFGDRHTKVYRRDIKLHLCNSARAKDSNVRQALVDRFPANGGGKTPQIGTKAQPGPLYGVRKDIWAALGVAVTWAETMGKKCNPE